MSRTEMVEGIVFDNMIEARLEVNTWLVRNGLSSRITESWSKKTAQKCINRDCPFTLNLVKFKDGEEVKLTKLVHHTCPVSTYDYWHGKNSPAVLARNAMNVGLFVDDPQARPKQLRRQELRNHGNKITPLAAWRTRETIRFQQFGDEAESFKKIPGLLSAMREAREPGRRGNTYPACDFKLEKNGDRFERCWVAPRAL